jgi:excisionase family DNA binding protein
VPPADRAAPAAIPRGLDAWLEQFVRDAMSLNDVLRASGAADAALVREKLLQQLLEGAEAWLSAEVSVAQAAERLGVSEETVRRRIRSRHLPARRNGDRGRFGIERRHLAGNARSCYDPIADAQDIAKLRRSG